MTTAHDVITALKEHKNVLLYGPPGTGKSHLMNEVARLFAADENENSATVSLDTSSEEIPFVEHEEPRAVVRWVTFHQSYAYEDFVIGLRPTLGDKGEFSLSPRPGLLLELAAEAISKPALMVIDEINRGNASRIFGEFITLMEPSKRLSLDGTPTPTSIMLRLPHIEHGEVLSVSTSSGIKSLDRDFGMSANLYTLASMNSVDKSTAPLDAALRRRFHIVSIFPSDEAVASAHNAGHQSEINKLDSVSSRADISALVVALFKRINKGVGVYLGPDFMLGQWYIPALPDDYTEAKSVLIQSWLFRIAPQLIEMFHGRYEPLVEILRLKEIDGSGIELVQPDAEAEGFGASAYLMMAENPPTAEQLIEFMRRMAKG